MKNILIGVSLAILAAGSAFALESERHDADGDGVLTRAEAQVVAQQVFARMDANSDGKLDAADRTARRAAHFDRLDADKDGTLTRAEFSARPERPAGAPPQMGRGRGPDRGFGGPRWHGGPTTPGLVDADKDGAVSRAEFTAAALTRFDATDADRNGRVTWAERKAHRDRMRAGRGHHGSHSDAHPLAPAP